MLKRRVFESCRDGVILTIKDLLANLKPAEVNELLNTPFLEGQATCTPIIIASLNGHDEVLRFLLEHYRPDLEIEGEVEFGGCFIQGTTALWCAAGFGHYNVVRTLVQNGANVNHATKTLSTPLRAACFDGRLDIVRYLIDHGADMAMSNKFDNTCLMIAAYKGHLDIVEYLLLKDCDPNKAAKCGGTAAHFAAETGSLEVVKCLIANGAKLVKNAVGMTPLLSAAERTRANIVEYLVSTDYITRVEKIDALELLGASYANDKDSYSFELAFYYLNWAMKERFQDPDNPLPKKNILPPIQAYDFRIESRTPEELDQIRNSLCAIHMEGLIIRERILGQRNPEIAHPIVFRGALYADTGRFDRCLPLWLHALKLKRLLEPVMIKKDLLRFVLIFSQMFQVGATVPFDTVCDLLDISADSLAYAKHCSDLLKHVDTNFLFELLYLLVIAAKVLGGISSRGADDEDRLCRLMYRLVKFDLRDLYGNTLLHLSVSSNTPVKDSRMKSICKFPSTRLAKLLIKAGADVNAMNHKGDTPLHIVVNSQKPVTDFLTLHALITCLVQSNAHLDFVNRAGRSALQSAATGVADIIFKTVKESKSSLKCLSARVICRHRIPYESQIPAELRNFVRLHGPR